MFQQLLEQIMEAQFLDYKAGWIHPDGSIEYFKSYSGVGEDHCSDVYKKVYNEEPNSSKDWVDARDLCYEYMVNGNIRFIESSSRSDFSVSLETIPLQSQLRVLRKKAKEFDNFEYDMAIQPGNHYYSGGSFQGLLKDVRSLSHKE